MHAAIRTAPVQAARLAPAWREECYAVAALAVSAVGLNWITTSGHLVQTICAHDWPVATVDLILLTTAMSRLRRYPAQACRGGRGHDCGKFEDKSEPFAR